MIIGNVICIGNPESGSGAGVPNDFMSGWNKRKSFTVAASSSVESIIELTVYNTSGTDTTTTIYLGGNVRSDWGDLRFTLDDKTTTIPYAIIRNNGTNINVAVNLGTVQNGTYYIYWDGPAQNLFKIGHVTDVHYNPGEVLDNRQFSLDFCDSFVDRMDTFLPNLVAKGGDDIGDDDHVTANRFTYMQAVIDHIAPAASGPSTPEVMHVAPGNHDFDFTGFSGTRAVLAQSWMEANVLYGKKEVGNYLIISLDANYNSSTDVHMSNTHQGNGHINPDQLTWLTSALSDATKPVIIFCHQPLSEMDTDQFTLTKEVYHTDNRAAVRDIIEASGKVVCCIQGHVHYSRIDVINGIPYINITNIGNTGQFGEQPATNSGKWGLITLDESSKTIKVQTEAVVSGVVQLIYEQTVGFGPTSFTDDVSHHPARVYSLGYTANFEKSSIYRDPVAAYVTDDDFLYKYPTNYNIPDPYLSDSTVKIVGRTNSPSFGRTQWRIAPQTGTFRAKWSARVSTVKTKFIKFGDSNVVTAPGVYIQFNNDGNIKALNAGVTTSLQAYSANTWYAFELVANISTDKFDLWIDGVLKASNFSFNNNLATIDRVENVTETGNMYLDCLRISPYTNIAITDVGDLETT